MPGAIKKMLISSLTEDMLEKAKALNEGPIIAIYNDNGYIRIETDNGEDPYVWRNNQWRPMRR